MRNIAKLRGVIEDLIARVGSEPFSELLLSVIEPKDLEEYIARLSYYVAPSYLPFLTDDGGTMVVHLWPGRALEESPVLYVPTDEKEARFVCDRFTKLPTALWLWVARYFKDEPDVLRRAIEAVAAGIPGSKRPPDALWTLLKKSPKFTPTLWASDAERYTNQAWMIADVGHPFVDMPKLKESMRPKKALSPLEPFVASRPDSPELLSVLLATQAEAGIPRRREDILKVLSSEAWRNLSCVIDGWWRKSGSGMCEWDCTLRNIEDPEAMFKGTPFAALIGHPETYSGDVPDGPANLIAVAKAFRKLQDSEGELRQLRNAATLYLIVGEEYPTSLGKVIAKVCDSLSPDSLAAAVASESARTHKQGP
jgi:hypothetical protein